MNFKEFETPQKLRGGFYTHPQIASFLTRWVLAKNPKTILEPSCGDGAFIEAAINTNPSSIHRIFACEINKKEAIKAEGKNQKPQKVSVEIHTGDFLKWFLFSSNNEKPFDGAIGNPPFIRYQYLPEEQQLLSEKIFALFGLPFTKHTNAWVPFVLCSLALLAPGGRLGMVIPSEIFHIPHAQSLRRYLVKNCSRILIIDPEELWFGDTLQGVVLLLAEKKTTDKEKSQGVAVKLVHNRDILNEKAESYFEKAEYTNGTSIDGKWMSLFLTRRERSLLKDIQDNPHFTKFSEIASVDVGIVTGANKFFLVNDEVVKSYGLRGWAHPMFGRSEHVAGVIYSELDHKANKLNGLPTNFLWFKRNTIDEYPSTVQKYILSGESEGLPTRFKCRVRTPWFKVPSVHASPVAMLKRAHNFPRLVLNEIKAFSTDTAYRIQPGKIPAPSLVYSFLNSLTCLTAELEGRHYGGGVLELVPSEIERLVLPIYKASLKELQKLDFDFRNCTDECDILTRQDRVLLRSAGLSSDDCNSFNDAWVRLKNRRQRNSIKLDVTQEITMKNDSLKPAVGP